MTFKDKKILRRKFTPQYYSDFIFRAIITLLCLGVTGVAIGVTAGLLLSQHLSDDIYMILCIIMMVWLVAFFTSLIVLLVFAVKLRKRIIAQRTAELAEEFTDMPLEEADAALVERNVITEHGFVANIGEYAGKLVVPFNEANVTVYSANIYTKIFTAITISNMSGVVIAEYILDNVLYNYVFKKGVKIDFQGNSKYFVNDRVTFVKKNFNADSEKRTTYVLFGALGAFISDEMNKVNSSRKIVLRIVGKEYLQ